MFGTITLFVRPVFSGAKWGMPEKVKVGGYELNLIWQKDLSTTHKQGTLIGSHGDIGYPLTLSEDGKYIGVNLHAKEVSGKEYKSGEGVFYLLDKKGKTLWSKRLNAYKQTGTVSKNGSTVLLDSIVGEWQTKYFVYNVNGKQIGHGNDELLATLSGNGEYLLFFDIAIRGRAFLYDKHGKLMWKYTFKSDSKPSIAVLTYEGNVILLDDKDILFKEPGGGVLWRVKNPIMDPEQSAPPHVCYASGIVFEIVQESTSKKPIIVAYCKNYDDIKYNKISIINSKGGVLSEIVGCYYGTYVVSADGSIVTGANYFNDNKSIWIWDVKNNDVISIPITTKIRNKEHIYTDGNLACYQGSYKKSKDTIGISFEYQLLFIDIKTMGKAKIPSYYFSVSPEGSYLVTSLEDGRLSFYSIKRK